MAQRKLTFYKMVGAGNDFIVIEAKKGLDYKKLAVKVCDRTNGVGADGLVVLDRSAKSDYRMRIINADGSEAEMCGNGVRCLAVYIKTFKKPKKKLFSIETLAGTVLAETNGEIANVRLSDPQDYRANILIDINGRTLHVHYIDTGVPHAIVYVDGLDAIDVNKIGPQIRNHQVFAPRGTNVNFVEQINTTLVAARTYERGVEGETKACGTGSVACALVSYFQANPDVTSRNNARMKVKTKSGEVLDVKFNLSDGKISDVWLKGSAKFIAEGQYWF